MTPLEATEAVYEAARVGVAAIGGTSLYLEGERSKPAAGTPWVRVSVRHQPTRSMSLGVIGSRRVERAAVVYGQCFVPHQTDDGVKAALTLAQQFRNLFEGIDVIGVGTAPLALNFSEADLRSVGVEGGWIQVNAECPFTFVEIR